jgi:hypothetical protein
MSDALHIRDFDLELLKRLKKRAVDEGETLRGYVTRVLREALNAGGTVSQVKGAVEQGAAGGVDARTSFGRTDDAEKGDEGVVAGKASVNMRDSGRDKDAGSEVLRSEVEPKWVRDMSLPRTVIPGKKCVMCYSPVERVWIEDENMNLEVCTGKGKHLQK